MEKLRLAFAHGVCIENKQPEGSKVSVYDIATLDYLWREDMEDYYNKTKLGNGWVGKVLVDGDKILKSEVLEGFEITTEFFEDWITPPQAPGGFKDEVPCSENSGD